MKIQHIRRNKKLIGTIVAIKDESKGIVNVGFSVEKVTFENKKDHSKFFVYTDHSSQSCPPSEVPEKIVDRNSLIEIIKQMVS